MPSNLGLQVPVVAVVKHEHLVAQHFRFTGLKLEQFIFADIALLQVGYVAEHQQFDLFRHLVLQHLLHEAEVHLGYLKGGLGDVTRVAVPVGVEVMGFVVHPLVELPVVLHPVFSKRSLGGCLSEYGAGRCAQKQGKQAANNALESENRSSYVPHGQLCLGSEHVLKIRNRLSAQKWGISAEPAMPPVAKRVFAGKVFLVVMSDE